MNDLKNSPHAALTDFYNQTEEILAKLDNPTQEAAEKALSAITFADIDSIIPFTGYYNMVIPGATGAFLSIDTVESYHTLSQKITVSVAAVTVTVSMDGTTSKTYKLDQTTRFVGTTLTIPNVLSIILTRQYVAGALVTFKGAILSQSNVTGSTQFNPIKLSTFNGGYYAATTTGVKKVLTVNDSTTVPFKTTISFDFGSGLREIRSFTYTPLMFVLMFSNPDTGDKYVLMLGTAGKMGLACFIQHGATGEYAVTIPYAQSE